MSALTNNSLQGFLQVYAQESLEQFVASMPNINLFTKNFDSSIASGGTAITTRISTTNWGTANDLTQGWANTGASSSAITATLKLRNFDILFDELQWATITQQVITNTYLPQMIKQLSNSIVVDAINNVTSSYFTSTITPASSSLFTVTGSTNSLQAAQTTLTNNEIPIEDRYAIVSPNIYSSLMTGILPTYFYGSPDAIQNNTAQKLLGTDLHQYPRFVGATLPQGGNVVTGVDKLVGIVGNHQGLVCAVRAPADVNFGTMQSATATDAKSGLSVQTRLVWDVSKPAWRIAVVGLWGTAAGNSKAIIPIITQSV